MITREEKQAIRAAVVDVEERMMTRMRERGLKEGRILDKFGLNFHGDVLDFSVFLEAVSHRPKFITFRFAKPRPASFIFLTYDPQGKRYMNPKIFNRMVEFLAEEHLGSRFVDKLAGDNS